MSVAAGADPVRRRGRAWIATVVSVCAVLYCLRLGEVAFLGKDEPKNAQAAREMLRSGDWVVTTLEGKPWFDKPILYYWTAMVGYRLVGVGELGARLGPVLGGLLAVWITYLLGRRALSAPGDGRGGRGSASGSGPRAGPSKANGTLAAFVLGTGPIFFYYARTAVTDSLLTAFVTGSLTAYFFAREGIRPRRNMHLAWACSAVAVLAKGPVGLLIPAMVVGADLLWTRQPGSLRRLRASTGLPLFLAVSGPWHALVIVRSHGEFLRDFILQRNLVRFATENLPHPGPFWYYLPVLLLAPYPWSVFLPGTLARLAREWHGIGRGERGKLRFFLLWITLPTIFFSFAGSKLPSYLLPVFPAVSILVARELRFLVRTPARSAGRFVASGLGLLAAVSLGTVAGGSYYVTHQERQGTAAAVPLFVTLVLISLAAVLVAIRRERRLVLPLLGAAAILVPLVVVLTAPQALEGRMSARRIALRAMELQPGPGQLLSYRFYDNSFFFYTDAQAERFHDLRRLEARLGEVGGSGLCFVRAVDLPRVLGHPGLAAEDLGSVERIHLLRLRLTGS